MECKKCGGAVYDNRQQNETRVAEGKKPMPEFKCKDSSCGWVQWPPKGQRQPSGPRPAQSNGGGKWTWGQLSNLYGNSLKLAKKHVGELLPEASPQETIAAAATIFIAASRDGVKPKEPPKAPEPPPPPPPETEGDEDDDLPF